MRERITLLQQIAFFLLLSVAPFCVACAQATHSETSVTTQGKTTPGILWSPAASIPAGTALNSSELDASAGVPGTFTYNPGVGTVLSPGTHTLTATFTPTNTA